MLKRFQYRARGGQILWTDKFRCRNNTGPIQYRDLKNEYFEEEQQQS